MLGTSEEISNLFLKEVSEKYNIPLSTLRKIWEDNINQGSVMKKTRIKMFLELGNYDETQKTTRFVCVDEFIGEYACLTLGNGGHWCRFDGTFGKKYKVCKVKANGLIEYSWKETDTERQEIEKEVNLINRTLTSGTSIYMIKVYGIQNLSSSRPIRKDIRAALENSACVVCGGHSIEIDHKNGLYNDTRVLNTQTQTIDDFQPLCKHCNDQKRQTYCEMKKTGKRYPATNIPSLKNYNIDFIQGNEEYNPEDVNAMVGTYWYDPIKFHEGIKLKLIINN